MSPARIDGRIPVALATGLQHLDDLIIGDLGEISEMRTDRVEQLGHLQAHDFVRLASDSLQRLR